MARRWLLSAALALSVSWPLHALAAERAPLSNADAALAQLATELSDPTQPLSRRLEVARLFGSWGSAEVREPLLATLKDAAPELREAGAQALGWSGNREAVPALRERVEADSVPAVKGAAVQALGVIADPSVRPLLVASTRDPEAAVRQAALWAVALGPLADPSDRVPYLIELAEDRALEGQLRCEAIRTLFGVNEDKVVGVLMRILENEPRFLMTFPDDSRNQQKIMELRHMQMRDSAAWAAEGLGQLQAKRAIPLLLKTAEDRSDFFLRLQSLQALIAMKATEAQEVFLRRLEDPVPDNRVVALEGLAHVADRTVIPSVLTRLNDPNGFVRAQAVTTLAALGDASTRAVLEKLQKTETDANAQIAIEEALAYLPR